MTKRKLLWIGQVLTETGYSRVSENILAYLADDWDIAVLGIAYDGEPHEKPYRIYRADARNDVWGVNRVHEIITRERPDVVAMVMEPWNLLPFIQQIRVTMRNAVKLVSYVIVDGENMKPVHAEWLAQSDICVFPTAFALEQAKLAGFNGKWYQIPHGVDVTIYQPSNQQRARQRIGLGNILEPDAFVFGNVNENQPRKRLDLTIEAWARWWKSAGKPANAYLYIHANKNSPVGWDLGQLANVHDIRGRIVAPAEDVRYGEASMRYVYNAIDVQFSTTMGEGFGLTSLEGMACGVPQIVPLNSALQEWAAPGALTYPAARALFSPQQQNVKMHEPYVDSLVMALNALWADHDLRQITARLGRQLALQEQFRWSMVAGGFHAALEDALQSGGVTKEFLVEKPLTGPSGVGIPAKAAD